MDLLADVVEAVHEVGAHLARGQRPQPLPAATVAEAMAGFAAVDGPAAELLRGRLTALYPRARWCEDELDDAVPADGEWWSCDATDGAVQYLSGLAHWAVTATLVRDGEPVLAVVHAPLQRLTYTAVDGGGARLGGRPVAPLTRELAVAVAAGGHPPTAGHDPVARRRAGESLTAVLPRVLAVRNLGPTSLQVAQVGSGHLGLFWEYGPDATNLLPGALIAREAGAAVTDAQGRPWTARADSFVAAAPSLHRDLLDVLSQVG
ncbi:inositol monophosphatase family protein [Kitasatospora sp. NPDC048540]|uniref:inositol monophosphatase family protein n=1 Tax=Kitasatospora sp. NPDC048540 TaxID=3155634 RepID=UPI00340A2F14